MKWEPAGATRGKGACGSRLNEKAKGTQVVSVKVVWRSSGRGAENQRVTMSFDGLRGVTSSEITDRNGEVHFDAAPGAGKVIVNGTVCHAGRIEGRVVVYI